MKKISIVLVLVIVLSLLSSLVKYVAGIIIVCQSLSLLGVNVGTIIASVGVLALVVGFSAESLIADVVIGAFMLLENQYNVGDIVGDVAGLGSDLLESDMGAISSAVILAFSLFTTNNVLSAGSITTAMLQSMFVYPVAFCSLGLIACVLGIGWLLMRKNVSDHPHKELNGATYVSAGLTLVLGLILTFIMFRGVDLSVVGFKLGWFSPWVGAALGLIAGVVIGMIASAALLLMFPHSKAPDEQNFIDGWSWALFGGGFVASVKKVNPILLICLSAAAGILIYYIF